MEPICEAKGISKEFALPHGQSLLVLDQIDITICSGEIVAIIGPSGCGKSTLLRIIAGLLPATKGKIFFHGKEAMGIYPSSALVFQNFALYPWMTVRENIEMVLKAIGLDPKEIQKRREEVIALTGLSGFEEAYPREISGGMKQRVGLARALSTHPEILLMDEPFSAVDALTAEGLRSELLAIFEKKTFGLSSIIFISHDVREVSLMADRIIVMSAHPGRIYTVIENKIPKPREVRSPAFADLVDELYDSYHYKKESAHPPAALQKQPITPLLPVSDGELFGLLTYLARRGGEEDVYKMSVESLLSFDKLTITVQAAELLHFAEMRGSIVVLTEIGRRFALAGHQERRVVWKNALLTIPLFIQVEEWLHESRQVPREKVLAFLEQELPHQDSHVQFNIFLRWSRYGNLFHYNKKAKMLLAF